MRSGSLRWPVAIQSYTATQDDEGYQIQTWTTSSTHYMEVVTLSGREAVNAQQIKAETTHRFRMRWIPTEPTPKDRLLFDGIVFNIEWVDNVDQRNRELLIYCKKVAAPS